MNYISERLCDFWNAMDKQFVTIDNDRLDEVAMELAKRKVKPPDWKINGVMPKNDRVFANHLLFKCAVDFCFRHWDRPEEKYEVGGSSGSEAMSRCFQRRFGERPINPNEILTITDSWEGTMEFFGGKNLPPLLTQRRENLREVAEVLKKDFRGDVMCLLETAHFLVSSDEKRGRLGIVDLLEKYFPIAFGQDPKFKKRSQLFPLMYQGRALSSESDLPILRDPENIGPIIDYQIPNVLRHYGILKYSKDLASEIDNREIIPKDSDKELEIRSGAACVMARLLEKINSYLPFGAPTWTMIELDDVLFSERHKVPTPHHLTPTTDY